MLLVTIIIVIVISIFQSRQINSSAELVNHTQDVLLNTEKLLAELTNNESASRGYVITGQKNYQEVSSRSRTELYQTLDELHKLTKDNPPQQRHLDSLKSYINQRLAFSAEIVALKEQDNQQAAVALTETGRGKSYTDTIKAIIYEVQKNERILLEKRRKLNEEKHNGLNIILLSVIACILMLIGFFIQKIRGEFAERKEAAAKLEEMNERLAQKVEDTGTALTQSKEKLEETFLRITDAFLALDKNWNYTYVNKQLAEMVNRTPESLIGKNVWEEFPGAVGSATYDIFHRAMKEQQYLWNEDYFAELDLWQENHVYPSPDGLSVYIRDVSEKKRKEKELEESYQRYQYVTKATSDAIWDWDVLKGTLYWGDGFESNFGYKPGQLRPDITSWSGHIHEDDLERVTKSMYNAIEGDGLFWEQEYRYLKADGNFAYVIDKGFIIRNAEGKTVRMIGAMQDFSKRKDAELALKQSESELSRLNAELSTRARELAISNRELEQFAYVASHDLQEPLRMVTSFLTQLEKKYNDTLDEKGRQYIHFAVDGAKRMRQIILDLLEFSKAGRSEEKEQDVSIQELLDELLQLYAAEIAEKKVVINIGEMPVLHRAKAPLRQIFQNLLGNSLKYHPEGRQPAINITAKEKATHWEFIIQDNGIGIDPKYHEKVFVIFQRLHNRERFSGTGMGLAITKKIIENLGGGIWVESEEGKGSAFHFTIIKNILNDTGEPSINHHNSII
ncbi:CHASE3 domain-containing protein [Ferruginibacter sp. HRS2-29]|uniref:sensor histidine kinase n=1 Tax=Ferruginibacter sp. HRS2-29 TaxID=2487334 RepID=UPI0020CE1BEA|nr:CHASE3 domain-containing protein [Ferruginibacter sp. HRS2-29]